MSCDDVAGWRVLNQDNVQKKREMKDNSGGMWINLRPRTKEREETSTRERTKVENIVPKTIPGRLPPPLIEYHRKHFPHNGPIHHSVHRLFVHRCLFFPHRRHIHHPHPQIPFDAHPPHGPATQGLSRNTRACAQ